MAAFKLLFALQLSLLLLPSMLTSLSGSSVDYQQHFDGHNGHQPALESQTNQSRPWTRKRHSAGSSPLHQNRHCDDDDCGTLVDICLENRKCACDFKNDLGCVRRCVDCLEEKFGLCCGCLDGLCPHEDNELHSSHVGKVAGVPDEMLFETLTDGDDIHGRWRSVHTWLEAELADQATLGKLERRSEQEEEAYGDADYQLEQRPSRASHLGGGRAAKLTCNIAFINKPLSMTKCRRSCTSMGATYFRWFHEGCCECVGQHCFRYGLARPQCAFK